MNASAAISPLPCPHCGQPLPSRPLLASVTVPVRTVSEANQRDTWFMKAGRAQGQRGAVALSLRAKAGKPPLGPLHVVLTRLAPGTLDDDNLASSLKACRDGCADWLGIDDRDPRVSWQVLQERSKTCGVRVDIYQREAP
jgi:hypothetical protein